MIRLLPLLTAAVLSVASPGRADEKGIDFAPLDEVVIAEMKAGNIPGVVVVVVRGDRVNYSKGFGVASAEGPEPVTPDHLFRIGSTTKMFVGATAAKLAAAGKLKLDRPVGEVVPGLPDRVAAVTPHQLLTHTAGLADAGAMYGKHDDEELGGGIAGWTNDRLFATPGDIFSYSNPGYWLAGYAVERAAGKPFADAVAAELFAPLGMKRTTFRPTLAMTYPLAQGHELRAGKPEVTRPMADNAATWPAGSMFSSGNDLARFVIAFLNGGKLDGEQVLPPEVIKAVSTAHVTLPAGRGGYGYGLVVRPLRGVPTVSHDGSRVGYGSSIAMAPEQKVGVIVLCNRTGAGMPKTVAKVAELTLPLQPAEKPGVGKKPEAEELARLAGTYRNGLTAVRWEWADGALTQTRPTGGKRITAAGGDRFRVDGTEYVLVTGADGKTQYLLRGTRALKKAN